MGSSQIIFSTAVPALAQSKLAAWAPNTGRDMAGREMHAMRMKRRRMTLTFARVPRPDNRPSTSGMREVPAVHPRRAGTPHLTLSQDGKCGLPPKEPQSTYPCNERGYEVVASETQSEFVATTEARLPQVPATIVATR